MLAVEISPTESLKLHRLQVEKHGRISVQTWPMWEDQVGTGKDGDSSALKLYWGQAAFTITIRYANNHTEN